MKNLLVLTDFSTAADTAADYAVVLANQLQANITVFHSYQVYSTTGSFLSVERHILDDIEQDIGKVLLNVRQKLEGDSTATAKHIKGDPVATLARVAERDDYDLVIMGNHGAGMRKSIFWGTTTSGIVEQTKAPVLAVPEGFQADTIKNIVLAIDGESLKKVELQSVFAIAKAFDAKLWLCHISEKGGEAIDFTDNDLFEGINYEIITVQAGAVEEGIQKVIDAQNADLLCMIKRKRGFWESFFRKSLTIEELFLSSIPLLVLHEV